MEATSQADDMEDIPPELEGIPPEMAKYARAPTGVECRWAELTLLPPSAPRAAYDFMEMVGAKITSRPHMRALQLLQGPWLNKFTVMPFDERDLALINAPRVPGVAYYTGQSFLLCVIQAEVGKEVGEESHTDKTVNWTADNDQLCKSMLVDAGHVEHGFETGRVTAPRPLQLQQQITVKVQILGCGGADFKWGILTAMAGKGSPRGDVRIFKGPRSGQGEGRDRITISRDGCDGIIIRNAVASSWNLENTSLDRVWDILLLGPEEDGYPWKVCAMREVEEPGGRVISKDVKVAGGTRITRIPDAKRTRDLQAMINNPKHPLDEPLDG